MSIVEVVVVALVAFRLYVMADRDKIFEVPRTWVEDHAPGWLVYQIHCPWCIGWWACGIVTALVTLAHWTTTPWPVLWVASSALVGLIGERT